MDQQQSRGKVETCLSSVTRMETWRAPLPSTHTPVSVRRELMLMVKYRIIDTRVHTCLFTGICHGPATLRTPQGDTEERMYEAGKLHGTATFFR